MAKFKEKICINCKHWVKTHRDPSYHDIWVGTCPKQDILRYENSDCDEFKPK